MSTQTGTSHGETAVPPPSHRRAARKRAAEAEPPAPAPPIRRRRMVTAAAGRQEDLPAAPDGVPDAAGSTADMVAIVTREVLKQLREDRDAARAADVTPTAPAPSVDPAHEVVWPMAGPNIERDNPMDFAVAGALSTLMDDKGAPAPITCVPFHTTALGADLPERIKAKIWANEFVEFFELTHVHHFQPQQMAVSSGDSHQSSLCCPRPGEGRFPPSISGLLPSWCLGQYMPNVFRRQHPACLNIARLCVILPRPVHH